MSDQTNNTTVSLPDIQPQKPFNFTEGALKVLPLIVATFTLLAGMGHYNDEQNTRLAELRQTDALISARVTNAENDIRDFKELQKVRTAQWQEVLSSLARQTEKLDGITARLDRADEKLK